MTSIVSLCFKYISSLVESDSITESDTITYTTSKDILGIILLLLTISSYIYFAYKIIKRYLKSKNSKVDNINDNTKDNSNKKVINNNQKNN